MTRQAQHVKRRRAQGLCGQAGCEVVSGPKYRCEPHAADHAARVKRIYWDVREQLLRERARKAAA